MRNLKKLAGLAEPAHVTGRASDKSTSLLKRVASIALATIMTLALAVPAFASEGPEATITIANTKNQATYKIYRILDMTGSGNNTAYSIAEGWTDFFTTGAGAAYLADTGADGATMLNVGGTTKYFNFTEENTVVTFASAALAYALENFEDLTAAATITGNGNSQTVEHLPYGYYLTYMVGATERTADSDGSLCSLTNVNEDVTLKIKATTPTIDKTADTNVAGVGDTVNFTITGKVPDVTNFVRYTYKISDTMSNGLEFSTENFNAIKVYIGGTEITTGFTKTQTANGFTLTIDKDTLENATVGAEIKVVYSATVTADALNYDYAKNEATLEYSNDPTDGGEGTETTDTTTEVVVKIFTTSIDVDKYALNPEAEAGHEQDIKLAGAEFALYKEVTEDGATNPTKLYYVKDADGNISWTADATQATKYTTQVNAENPADPTNGRLNAKFDGLGNGTYWLEETTAPAGYNKLPAPIEVKIDVQPETLGADADLTGAELVSSTTTTDADGNTTTTNYYIVKAELNVVKPVQNSTGAELPETGGMGTTLFYALGGLLVVGAGILLITKKRMGAE